MLSSTFRYILNGLAPKRMGGIRQLLTQLVTDRNWDGDTLGRPDGMGALRGPEEMTANVQCTVRNL